MRPLYLHRYHKKEHLMKRILRVFLLTLTILSFVIALSGTVSAAPHRVTTPTKAAKAQFVVPPCTPNNVGDRYNLPVPGGAHYLIECQCFTMVIDHGGSTTECRWVYIGGGPYQSTWIDLNSGLYMDVEGVSTNNGAKIHQWTYTGANNQWWVLQSSSYGYGSVNMVNLNSGKCLGVGGGSTAVRAPIVQWDCNGNPDQTWFWAWTGHETGAGWPIFNVVDWNSGMCLGITGGSTTVGAYAVQWGCNTSPDQEWY